MIKFPKAKTNQCISCFKSLGTRTQAKFNKNLIVRHRISPITQCDLFVNSNIYIHRDTNFACQQCQPILSTDQCEIDTIEMKSTIQSYEKAQNILKQIITQIKQNINKSKQNDTFSGIQMEKLTDKKCKIYCGLRKDNIEYLASLTGDNCCHFFWVCHILFCVCVCRVFRVKTRIITTCEIAK